MLTWATEFPIEKGGADDVLRIAKHALETSPFTPWRVGDLPYATQDELIVTELGEHRVTLGTARADDGGIIAGSQHHWIEREEREWTTEVLACQNGSTTLAAVRVECNLLRPGPDVPVAKKPYVVKRLIQELGGAVDAGFKVTDYPHRLAESDVARAANVVLGSISARLPFVYVSVGKNRRPHIDTDELSSWLGGMAHVIVEPSRYFAFALARNTGRMNAYGGAVSIYWPQGASSQARFLPKDYDTPDAMQRDIAGRVRLALTQIRPTSNCTFEYLQELVSRRRVESIKSQGTANVENYVEVFDAELRSKDEKISSLEGEVQRLRGELRRHDYAEKESAGLISYGKEREFYPGEVRDAVLHVLENGKNSLLQDGRRAHLISDILENNAPSEMEPEYVEDIKNAFSESGELDADSRRTLEDLGFTIESGGKHWKVVYQGDDRYTFTISKSSSDYRSGKNLASTILKKLFK